MEQKLSELWHELQRVNIAAEGFRMHLLETSREIFIYAAVSNQRNYPALVVELPSTLYSPNMTKLNSRVFEAIFAEFPGLRYGYKGISLQLLDPTYEDLFLQLCKDIVSCIRNAENSNAASRVVFQCIQRWRRFIERGSGAMSEEEVRGLIGELVILARCINQLGAVRALECWQGPEGTLRDFELPDISVEVKTYQVSSIATIRINDPEQLELDLHRPVYLAVVPLRKVETKGHRLPDVVERIFNLLKKEHAAQEIFEQKLASCGYLRSQENKYSERYIAGPVTCYVVEGDFPRLENSNIPAGVVNVNYSIHVNTLKPYLRNPDITLGSMLKEIEVGD
jgi:hypothetical protein